MIISVQVVLVPPLLVQVVQVQTEIPKIIVCVNQDFMKILKRFVKSVTILVSNAFLVVFVQLVKMI